MGTSLICNDADHEHDEELEGMGGNETDPVVAEAREREADVHYDEICSCETGELVCDEHEGEEGHEHTHEEDCHCDGDVKHCETEEAEAECHCDNGEVHCEEHEEGEGVEVFNSGSGASCLAVGGAFAATVAALM